MILTQRREKTIIVGVRTDPKPNHVITVADGKSSVSQTDPGGEDRPRSVHLFEVQARMARIIAEQAIGTSSLPLDL